jgi:hypothetical protein
MNMIQAVGGTATRQDSRISFNFAGLSLQTVPRVAKSSRQRLLDARISSRIDEYGALFIMYATIGYVQKFRFFSSVQIL